MTPKKTVWIDTAPLIASPEPTGQLRECEVLHDLPDRPYLGPINPHGTPLHVARSWIRTPSVVIMIRERTDGKWSYYPRAAEMLARLDEGEFETEDACLEAAGRDRSIPKGAGFSIVPRPALPTLTYWQDPGHGWVETTMRECVRLGIAEKISPYSYMDRQSARDLMDAKVYLEEDCDMPLLIEALRAERRPPNLVTVYRENIFIRDLPSFGQVTLEHGEVRS